MTRYVYETESNFVYCSEEKEQEKNPPDIHGTRRLLKTCDKYPKCSGCQEDWT